MAAALESGSPDAILLVDGYNAIAAWPSLQKLFRQSELDLARHKLVETLSSYVAFRNYAATVIFDAHAQPAPATQELSASGIEIYYTAFGETADTAIERRCAQLRWEDCRVRVATSDRTIQLVVGGYDAEWLSVQNLQEEVQHAVKHIQQTLKQRRKKPQRGIGGYLDERTRDRLMQWRLQGSDGV
ncbi:MAG: NYN domain-containing protein [Cyanobacteria bacterium P01_D01_bin.123]